jgi:hypothetical protein
MAARSSVKLKSKPLSPVRRCSRWRQILSEAKRIDEKHLLTLESPISPAQTDEMRHHRVQLVVPKALHVPYTPGQRQWLMGVKDFVSMARETRPAGSSTTQPYMKNRTL